MTPRPPTPRPIRRAPEPRPPYLPPAMSRLMAAIRGYRHQLRPRSQEVLALLWADLATLDDDRLDAAIRQRLALPENERWLIARFDPRDKVEPAGGGAGSALTALWMPPAVGEGEVGRSTSIEGGA